MKKLKQILAITMVVMMGVVFMPMMPKMNGVVKAETGGTAGGCTWDVTNGVLTISPTPGGSGIHVF